MQLPLKFLKFMKYIRWIENSFVKLIATICFSVKETRSQSLRTWVLLRLAFPPYFNENILWVFVFGEFIWIQDAGLYVQDQFDTIDLSDNEIVKFENFPFLNRLGTLLLNNNRITRINPNLGGETLNTIKC